jgi:hypothetical protein
MRSARVGVGLLAGGLDQIGRPEMTDGLPYTGAVTPESFFARLVEVFGAARLARGPHRPHLARRAGGDQGHRRTAIERAYGLRPELDICQDRATALSRLANYMSGGMQPTPNTDPAATATIGLTFTFAR